MRISKLNNTIIAVIIFSFFFFIFFLAKNGAYSKQYKHIALPLYGQSTDASAGDVVTGFRLQQSIQGHLFDNPLDAQSPLCINVLLTNYGNRKNYGNFALTLRADDISYKVVDSAKTVLDNKYHTFCYPGHTFRDVAHKSIQLILEGVDGKAGSAITAWLTKDTIYGKANINGVDSNQSLIVNLETTRESQESHKKSFSSFILTLLCGLSSILIFLSHHDQLIKK